jgi:hypothetical protein
MPSLQELQELHDTYQECTEMQAAALLRYRNGDGGSDTERILQKGGFLKRPASSGLTVRGRIALSNILRKRDKKKRKAERERRRESN